jgi:hypothetical protein
LVCPLDYGDIRSKWSSLGYYGGKAGCKTISSWFTPLCGFC